ncbi:MAG: (5-formylfuran-3-yl)methyl phosphate synthase [Acidobacteriota bacterium]
MRRVRLLVSVTNGHEGAEAIAGGADIIDAKDPSKGALGAVGPDAWAEIRRACPKETPTSVALGDLGGHPPIVPLMGAGVEPPTYIKVGLAGIPGPSLALSALRAFVAGGSEPSAGLIVSAYADHDRANSPPPETLPELALTVGASGCLLDTYLKDGSCLLDWIDAAHLRCFVNDCRSRDLLCALAGSLKADHLPQVAALAPDFIGVRGAACNGDRVGGRVTRARVSALAAALNSAHAA